MFGEPLHRIGQRHPDALSSVVWRGDFARVARVLGAIQAMIDDGGGPLNYHDNVIADMTLRATDALGQSTYEAERSVGLQMTVSERLNLITAD